MITTESRLRVARLGLKSALDAMGQGRHEVARDLVQQSADLIDREIEVATAAAKQPARRAS